MSAAVEIRKLALAAFVVLVALFAWACASNDEAGDGDSDDAENTPNVECTTDDDCDGGFFCSASGRCLDACRLDSDCPEGICDGGFCVECVRDSQCQTDSPSGYCDRDYNVCRVGCDSCYPDQECVDDRCVRPDPIDGDGTIGDGDSDLDGEQVAECGPGEGGLTCEPGCNECADRNSMRTCMEDGSGFARSFCEDGAFCNFASGSCEGIICEPLSLICSEDGRNVMECKNDGSGYIDTPCASEQTCVGGECVNMACRPDEGTHLFTFSGHSSIASADRFCQYAMNIGSAEWVERPERGAVAAFDGDKARMLLTSIAGNFQSEITIGADVYLEAGGGGTEVIMQKGDPLSYRLALEDNKPVFRISIGGKERRLEGTTLERSQWVNLIGRFDGYELSLWVDGEQAGEPAVFDNLLTIDKNSAVLSIGAQTTPSGLVTSPLKGYLDNIFLSGRAISEGEIAYLADSANPCDEVEIGSELACDSLCERENIAVEIRFPWTPTEVVTTEGEAFYINPGGCPHPSSTSFCIPPDGLSGQSCNDCPLSSEVRYALLARLGDDGTIEYAGEPRRLVANSSDTLYLGYNDVNLEQNKGAFGVVVEQGYCANSQCPSDMVPIPGKAVCIDRYEASCPTASEFGSNCNTGTDAVAQSVPGIIPWTNITPEAANLACTKGGKRLCKQSDWGDACTGLLQTTYPYGDTHQFYTCNDYGYNPPAPYDTLVPTSYLVECVSETGAFDLSGNAGEWVELENTPGYRAMAGKSQSSDFMSSCSDFLDISIEDPLTGFRCCKDLN